MSSPRSPRRVLRFFLILVLCFGALSWSSSNYFTSPDLSSLTKEKQQAGLFELPDALDSTGNASRTTGTTTRHEHRPGLNLRQTVPELSFIQRLQMYETQGHNTTSLLQLPSMQSSSNNSTITTIIHALDTQSLKLQLDAITTQTTTVHSIWIICTTKLQQIAETYAQKQRSSNLTILVINMDYLKPTTETFPSRSAGATPWLSLLTLVQTEYVWILEDGVAPNSDYLKTIHGLLQTNEYKDALLGTHATLLPANINTLDMKLARSQLHCLPGAFHFLPKRTQPVDMIHHVWFLRASWIPSLLVDRRRDAMESPLAYYISQSLLSYAAIPSIVIPPPSMSSSSLIENASITKPLLFIQHLPPSLSCTNTIPVAYQQSEPWKRILALQSNPTALDQQQRSLMTSYETPSFLFLIDGPTEAKAFLPLLCRFGGGGGGVTSSQQISIHVAVTGKQRGISGSLLSTLLKKLPECHVNAIIHDLDLYNVLTPVDAATRTALLLSRLVQALQPRILFHIQQNTPMFHSLDTLAKSYHLSTIQIPINDVQHVLWISKLPVEALQHWNQINIELVVITDRRPHSLSRLFNSIEHGTYLGDKVDLTIHMEQSSDRVTRMFVNTFPWNHGTKHIRHRIRKGGLMPAIIESWYPSDNDNYGVILEDDIEVSPLFYVWIKYNILHYRYSNINSDSYPWIYGISLYSPRNLELLPEGRIAFDPNDVLLPQNFPPRTPYGSQVPCSWGAVYFPEHWREFHQYLTSRLLDLQAKPPRLNIRVPNSRSERWKKSWKKYFIEMVYLRAYVMVYPNFQDFESFSTNHLEFGTHIKHDRAQTALDSFVVPLMQRDTLVSQLPNHQLPNFEQLPMMDLWGHLMPHQEMDMVAAGWHQKVSACARRPSHQRFNPQDLLCPFPLATKNDNQSLTTGTTTTKKKQIKTVLTKHMLEHVEYVTMYYGEQQDQAKDGGDNMENLDMNAWDDMPEPLDVAKMTTSASDHEYEDDEYKDLEENWTSLQEITKQG